MAAQPPGEVDGPAAAIDDEAARILKAMSDVLKDASRFALDAEEVFDEIPDVGPRRSLVNMRRIAIERPNRVVADVTGEVVNRTVWFNAGRLTVLDKAHNTYATLEAPPVVHEMLRWAADEYGIDVQLSDLFYPDVYDTLVDGVIRGEYLGLQAVEGIPCHHLAFEQATIDWQIWIQDGSSLPRKLTIAYKTEFGEPQYTAFLRKWNLTPTFPPDLFEFHAPEGAIEVNLERVLDADANPEPPGASSDAVTPERGRVSLSDIARRNCREVQE